MSLEYIGYLRLYTNIMHNRKLWISCVTDRAEKNPATKVKVTEAMQVRGYSNCESANLMLQMQVRCTIQRNGKARRVPKRGCDQSPGTVPFPR